MVAEREAVRLAKAQNVLDRHERKQYKKEKRKKEKKKKKHKRRP